MLHMSIVSLKTVAISLKRLFYIYGSSLHHGMPVYQNENNKRHICWNIYYNICCSIFWLFSKAYTDNIYYIHTYIHTQFYIHTYIHEMVCLVKRISVIDSYPSHLSFLHWNVKFWRPKKALWRGAWHVNLRVYEI